MSERFSDAQSGQQPVHNRLAADLNAEATAQERLQFMNGFMKEVQRKAEKGDFMDSEGVGYSTEDVKQMFSNLHDEFNDPKPDKSNNPLLEITRSGGLREVVGNILDSESRDALLKAIEEQRLEDARQESERIAQARKTGAAVLDRPGVVVLEDGAFKGDPRRVPGHPANPATEMNGAFKDMYSGDSVDTQVVEEKGHTLEVNSDDSTNNADPFDDLSETAQRDVLAYRRVLQNKRESEQAKDFAQVAEDKRAIYRVQQSLGQEAKQFLNLA